MVNNSALMLITHRMIKTIMYLQYPSNKSALSRKNQKQQIKNSFIIHKKTFVILCSRLHYLELRYQ